MEVRPAGVMKSRQMLVWGSATRDSRPPHLISGHHVFDAAIRDDREDFDSQRISAGRSVWDPAALIKRPADPRETLAVAGWQDG